MRIILKFQVRGEKSEGVIRLPSAPAGERPAPQNHVVFSHGVERRGQSGAKAIRLEWTLWQVTLPSVSLCVSLCFQAG